MSHSVHRFAILSFWALDYKHSIDSFLTVARVILYIQPFKTIILLHLIDIQS